MLCMFVLLSIITSARRSEHRLVRDRLTNVYDNDGKVDVSILSLGWQCSTGWVNVLVCLLGIQGHRVSASLLFCYAASCQLSI